MSDQPPKFKIKFENFGYALVIIGLLFTIMHWPGGRFFLFCGILVSLVLYLFSGFNFDLSKFFKPKQSRKEREKESLYSRRYQEKRTDSLDDRAREQSKNTKRQIGGQIIFKFGYVVSGIGLLFKVVHWPGGNFFLVVGMTFVACGFIINSILGDD